MVARIPVSAPLIGPDDVTFVSRILAEKQVSGRAPVVREFEKSFAAYLGTKHMVACCNGTVALHLAVKSLNLKPGDEVLIPSFTMMSPLFALLYEGLKPKLVDVDRRYWIANSDLIRNGVTKKTKAILVVHTYGNVVAMDEIMELASMHGLAVIEDCAEALGATYRHRKAGTFGDVSTFSFFANKLITTGEGGAICTKDSDSAVRISSYHDLCFGKKNKFLHEKVGFNYRMSALQAALGLSQLRRIEQHLTRIRSIARHYTDNLSGAQINLHEEPPHVKGSFWMYSVVLKKGVNREAVSEELAKNGIETRPFFVPAHQQPACSKLFQGESYPVSERISKLGLNLPSGLSLTNDEIDYVSSKLRAVVKTASMG